MKMYNNETNELIGTITAEDVEFLKGHLEEESLEDRDYYINQDTLDLLADTGASQGLINLLKQAMGDEGEVEIRWVA